MQTVIDVINCVVLLQSSHNHAADRRAIKSNYLICQHQQNKLTSFQLNLILQHQTTCNVIPSTNLVQQQATRKPFLIFVQHKKGNVTCIQCVNHNTVFQRDSFEKIVRYSTKAKNMTFCCYQETIQMIAILHGKLYGFVIQGIIWRWYNVEFTALSNETVAI